MDLEELINFIVEYFNIDEVINALQEYVSDSDSEVDEDDDLAFLVDDNGFYQLI